MVYMCLYVYSAAEDINDILSTELMLTMTYLKQHPKVYWIWNHRRWCLENVPDGPDEDPLVWKKQHWAIELKTVEKMLEADARNCELTVITARHHPDNRSQVHAWDYRRYVLASMPIKRSEQEELAYTKRKIEANFSNFSAWHQRSKVFASIWENGLSDEAKDKDSGV